MDNNKFMSLMPYISADLVNMIVEKYEISEQQAIDKLYSSKLYALLEKEETKVWHYSTHMLYALFEEEQKTGNLEFPEV